MMFKKYLRIFEKKALKIEKRLRLVISVLLLTTLLTFSTFFYFDKAIFFILFFIIIGFFLTYFALLEDIKGVDWFGLFFMPIFLTIIFYLFYFLFPIRWLTRIPFLIVYSISLYAILLCSNIFNVGVEKSLQLYRPAFSINYFYQTLLSFMSYNILFYFKQIFYINFIFTFLTSFLLSFHLFWTVKLNKKLDVGLIHYGLFVGLVIGELAVILSFLPIKGVIASLFLTATFYSLGGLIYNYIDQRLFKETIKEYIFLWIFILIITIFSISY